MNLESNDKSENQLQKQLKNKLPKYHLIHFYGQQLFQ
jgi:hypothetical protein